MKVLCVGQNYAKHAKEMGATAPQSPIWFLKPDSAIIGEGQAVEVPSGIGEVQHEVELAVRVRREARRVAPEQAVKHLDALTVAVDVTARDLQGVAKKAGRPWTQAKGMDTFLPLGAWKPLGSTDLQAIPLRLSINGQARQDSNTREMTWTVAQLVAAASQWTTLRPGDILLTGTPDGVGPILPGDRMVAEAVGVTRLETPVMAGPVS